MKYRAQIDGLRAIAVLSVIFFHAGFSFMKRGFLGVDIFFVISGYLITSIIVNDLQNGTFTFRHFYERRIRRILPMLFTVLLASSLVAAYVMLPDELELFSQSLIASILFYANFFFNSLLGGYFSVDAKLQPLLHIWSLAVEEQFYLIFPVLLVLIFRFERFLPLRRMAAFWAVLVLFLASLGFYLIYGQNHPVFAFYMLPTRFWEMAAGALLALCALDKKNFSLKLLNCLSLLGLALLFYALIAVPKTISGDGIIFPHWAPLPAIIGTVLIIAFARRNTFVARLLSGKPLVAIGLVSYSAYLWHQPLFAFARVLSSSQPGKLVYWGLILATFILAALSWALIEQPFRKKKIPFKRVVMMSGSAVVFLCFAGVLIPKLFAIGPKGYENYYREAPIAKFKEFQCKHGPYLLNQCQYGDNPKVLLIGDSYAGHLVNALLSSPSKQPFMVNYLSACPPLLNFADLIAEPQQKEFCVQHQSDVEHLILNNKSIDYVILSTSILYYLDREQMLTKQGIIPSSRSLVEQKFREMIAFLRQHNKKPILVSPPPRLAIDTNICIKNVMRRYKISHERNFDQCDINQNDIIDHKNGVNALLDNISPIIPIIHLEDLMCENGICPVLYNGYGIYMDSTHFTAYGSAQVGEKFDLFGKIIAAADHFAYQSP